MSIPVASDYLFRVTPKVIRTSSPSAPVAFDYLVRITSKAVRTIRTPPAICGPFLFSQIGHYFSVCGGHLTAGIAFVTDQRCRELGTRFLAFGARAIHFCQVRSWFSKQVRARFAAFCRANFRTCFRAHFSTAAGAVRRCVCQWPPKAITSSNPAFLRRSKLFVRVAAFKDADFIHQSNCQEIAYPTGLRGGFYTGQHSMPSRASESVARFTNVMWSVRPWIKQGVDNEIETVGHEPSKAAYALGMMAARA